ncbi:MAG: hypothetical protein ACUVTD_08945 [Nitrososphaerales archaeon]
MVLGQMFILCVLSNKGVAQDVIPLINRYAARIFQKKTGGGFLCLVDLRSMVAYMDIPSLPIPVNRECNRIMKSISEAFDALQKLAEMERKVLNYIEIHSHKIRLFDLSEELGIAREETIKILEELRRKGLLRVGGNI